MTERRDFPNKVKIEAFQRSGGFCDECTARLSPGKFQYDHRIPWSIGGESILANCQVLCTNCHGAKTAKHDTPRAAKTKRQRNAHLGLRPKGRGLRNEKWKRKVSGEVVAR